MIAAIASAVLLVAASLAVGRLALTLCGRRDSGWLAGPVGLAVLLVIGGLVAVWDGRGTAIAIAAAAAAIAGAVGLGALRRRSGLEMPALAAAGLAALFAAIPFIANGYVGILGVGLVNDDMASHLLLADWIDERFRPEPVLIDQGYPLGPHALVAGLSNLLGSSSVDVFAGLTLAIPALMALVAYAALDGLRTAWRVPAAALVALPYMAAAYLAQEAFKEPIMALFVLGFALLLPRTGTPREAIPLGVLAAGTVYVYSFPGLAWLAGTAGVWALIELLLLARRPRTRIAAPPQLVRPALRRAAPAVGAGLAVLLALALPDFDRLRDFVDFRALHPDRANEGGLGNLRGQLSPLTALGIWPTSDFRTSASAASAPAVGFYAGALFAALAFALALPRWLRRYGTAIPAALLSAAVLYLAARAFGTVYTSAKALAIAAPLIALVVVGGLLARGETAPGEERGGGRSSAHPARSLPEGRIWPARVTAGATVILAVGFMFAAAFSSFLVLRQAPVGPEDHANELARIQPLVEGEKLLFLGRDNFILWELRGSKPFVAVRNFYDPYYVKPNLELEDVFAKFDFDSVTAETLARFPYVLTTRAAYASGAPSGYELVEETPSYRLWRQLDPPLLRRPGETDAEPGRVGGCDPKGTYRSVTTFTKPPVVESDWSDPTIEDGESSILELDLARGTWELSLRYDATREVKLRTDTSAATVPANLDYRGTVPFWRAEGLIEVVEPGPVKITATVEEPPFAGRLLGAHSVAHLGSLAATVSGAWSRQGSCRDYVDWYEVR